ncbi:hypothetical protein JJB11_25430 [Ramlibacter ginsenosidimutans]|uniref:Uncharacterized protein n=1 Tax=Ramlibacter ginsenosidimutans TaxID=502333 RepID=A0A934WP02_9BURK|nr:hypothetical protein [Ramlibacter ginsenosidimutans]MBK6009454.1 hypothetical protein [Ramlibacter ginsenosidimutans]
MSLIRQPRLIAAAAVAFGLLGVASAAQARTDVHVFLGVPGMVAPAPVYGSDPQYVQTAPVYVQPRSVYVQPQPVYVRTAPAWGYGDGYGYGRRDEWRREQWREHERHERHERYEHDHDHDRR